MAKKLNLIVETYQVTADDFAACPEFESICKKHIDAGVQRDERHALLTDEFSAEKVAEERVKSNERNAVAKGFDWRARLIDADKQPGDEGYIVFECRKACQTRGTADRKGHQFLRRYLKHGDFNVPVTMLQPAVVKPKG